MIKDKDLQKKYMPRTTAYLFMLGAFAVGFFFASVIMSTQTEVIHKQAITNESSQNMNANNDMLQHIAEEEIAMAQNPNNADGWGYLGNLYYGTKQYRKAIEAYEKALAIKPNNLNYMTDMGTMYRAEKNYTKALEVYDQVLAIDSQHKNARFNRGVVLIFDMGMKEEGIKTWKVLIHQDPEVKTPDGRLLSDFINELEQN